MRLSFHGAAQGVTGSCHLLEACGKRILVDCGLFQGSRALQEENREPFGFDPATLDFLLLTHAHLDHCGRIPLLVEQGFRGEILATAATFELARLVLEDSARLQEEEAERAKRHPERHPVQHEEPLYDSEAVEMARQRFGREAAYGQALELAPGLRVTFLDGGHILGSASLLIEAQEGATARRIIFSGDIGSPNHPIINDPTPCPEADFVVMETTYGGRRHRSPLETAEEFFGALRSTLDGGGNVLIPTFALERAQEILYGLREGLAHGILPASMRVFVDSPMASSATQIFGRHVECYDEHAKGVLAAKVDPFAFGGLTFTRDRTESKAINDVPRGAVILAGSGMCTGGRVMHHLERLLPRPECAIVFVGYAAQGTPARAIIEGAQHIRLFGGEVPVRARIFTINGFSGHADHDGLLKWHAPSGRAARTFLVHGDPEAIAALGKDLAAQGTAVEVPALHQAYEL